MSQVQTVSSPGAPALPDLIARIRPVAGVARDLGIRTEIELPRAPGIVGMARAIAETVGVRATIDVRADGICLRFSPA